jgi:hypothetical protein
LVGFHMLMSHVVSPAGSARLGIVAAPRFGVKRPPLAACVTIRLQGGAGRMPKWRFWETTDERGAEQQAAPPQPTRFSARPRTDLQPKNDHIEAARAEQLDRLRRRREAVMFDVQQAELAAAENSPWRERALLLDEAIAAIRSERSRVALERLLPGRPLEPTPIEEPAVNSGPTPAVRFQIGGEQFVYAEPLDWAERGTQLARSELERQSGDPTRLLPPEVTGPDRERMSEHLAASLFAFATDLRDRALAEEPFPGGATLADLAQPDPLGGWLVWGGHSAAGAAKQHRLRELEAEEQRMLTERNRELEEMERLAERLPIALRRLAEVDAEIKAVGVEP